MKAVNPRSIVEAERPWIENWSPDAHRLLLSEATELRTRRIALNLCSYCATRAIGEDPGVAQGQKATYRKILAELAEAGITPPPLPGRRGVAVTPSPYTGVRGLRSVEVSSAPTPAARRAASVSSAPMPAATSKRRRDQDGIISIPVAVTGLGAAAGLLFGGVHGVQAAAMLTQAADNVREFGQAEFDEEVELELAA